MTLYMKEKPSKETIIRTVLLVLALINQFLLLMGKSPLPIADETLREFVSLGLTIGASLWAWWKNNSYTQEAIKADGYLKKLRGEKDGKSC